MSGDVILYSDRRGIKVTDSSVTVGNLAYPIADLTYVAACVERHSRIGPFLIIAVGFSFLVDRLAQRSIGAALLAGIVASIGVSLLKESKPVYSIDLSLVAGERAPVIRGSEERITAIGKAINEAIERRLSASDGLPDSLVHDSHVSALSLRS
jgi:hypothetical protein